MRVAVNLVWEVWVHSPKMVDFFFGQTLTQGLNWEKLANNSLVFFCALEPSEPDLRPK